MTVTVAYAVVASADLATARAWWTQLLGREPDRVPMPSDIEWLFPAGGGLQLIEDAEHAGASSITLGVDDIDAELTAVARRGLNVPAAQTVPSGQFRLAMLTDPDGNTVVLAQETPARSAASVATSPRTGAQGMSNADRYRKIAAGFTDRVTNVPPGAWANPTPCEGWAARDIVGHVVEVAGFFLSQTTAAAPSGPSVEEDPLGAWMAARDAIQAALDDPLIAAQPTEDALGASTFEQTVGTFGVGDTLMHTWDLARATGQDESLDPVEVSRMLANMHQFDASWMRQSGVFGPAVDVPADADEQTRLIAFAGRRP